MVIQFNKNTSKVKQLSEAIRTAISTGKFKEGDLLPSINKISTQYNVARDTVFKAFNDLKEKGIIESTPTKGYFVNSTANNVFVLFDTFSPYKNDLYREIIDNLPQTYKVDLYFHNYDNRLFNNLILDSIGRYNLYIITNIVNDVYADILDRIDSSKVLLVDLGKFKKDKYSYICQGFDATLYECLLSGTESLKKYRKMNFIFPESSDHPRSCIADFEQFCQDYDLEYNVYTKETFDEADLTKECVYLFAKHSDLIKGVKMCRNKGWTLGKDVGFIVLNDTPMLEIIEDGITTISTDFKQMGRLTAEYIITRNKIQTYVPTKLILRGSL